MPIAQPLVDNPVFPAMVSQMVKIGEETGELEKMLGKIADFYEDEVDASVQALTSIIEPIMMIGVGVMVGIDDHLDVPADVQAADADQVARAGHTQECTVRPRWPSCFSRSRAGLERLSTSGERHPFRMMSRHSEPVDP